MTNLSDGGYRKERGSTVVIPISKPVSLAVIEILSIDTSIYTIDGDHRPYVEIKLTPAV